MDQHVLGLQGCVSLIFRWKRIGTLETSGISWFTDDQHVTACYPAHSGADDCY